MNWNGAGRGLLGSQLALQTAIKGFEVLAYDINKEALEKARERFNDLKERFWKINRAPEKKWMRRTIVFNYLPIW